MISLGLALPPFAHLERHGGALRDYVGIVLHETLLIHSRESVCAA
jgi:hypothetical protein